MAPMPKTGESRFYGSPEKAVAALIMWSYGGNSVSVMGSWDNWSTRCMPNSPQFFLNFSDSIKTILT